MNLYEIDKALTEAVEGSVDPETGEIIENIEVIEQLEMARAEKIENIALFIKNLRSDIEQLKAEKQAFAERQKRAEKKAEWLTNYLASFVDGEKIKGSRFEIGWRKSTAVLCVDMADVPEEYLRYAEPELNKTAVKDAIKAGNIVPGCELVTRESIQIK